MAGLGLVGVRLGHGAASRRRGGVGWGGRETIVVGRARVVGGSWGWVGGRVGAEACKLGWGLVGICNTNMVVPLLPLFLPRFKNWPFTLVKR